MGEKVIKNSSRINVNTDLLFTNNRTLIIACDQGFEHGPSDFNETNIDPEYIMKIALEGNFNAVAVQAGIAQKYYTKKYKKIPLLVKLNGKTKYDKDNPISRQHTSVDYAIKLGAKAVGYTIYLGSKHEQDMFVEFSKICEDAHKKGLPVICWMYPRGEAIENELETNTLAYGARIAMELGADVVKIKYNGDIDAMKWVVKNAGRAKLVIAGGSKQSDIEFLKTVEKAMLSGFSGVAVGRNVFQNKNPLEITKGLKEIIFNEKTAEAAFSKMKK